MIKDVGLSPTRKPKAKVRATNITTVSGQKIGYARVSTASQKLDSQKEAFADRFSVSETIDFGHGRLENLCLVFTELSEWV